MIATESDSEFVVWFFLFFTKKMVLKPMAHHLRTSRNGVRPAVNFAVRDFSQHASKVHRRLQPQPDEPRCGHTADSENRQRWGQRQKGLHRHRRQSTILPAQTGTGIPEHSLCSRKQSRRKLCAVFGCICR